MGAALWIAGVILGLFALDRLSLWAEARGWIYYRRRKRDVSAGGGVLDVMSVIDPGARYAAEVREQRHAEEDKDDGDDDGQRKPDDRVR